MSAARADGDDLLLNVRLTPGAAGEAVGGMWTDEKGAQWLVARVRAVPEKGRANAALIALLAKRLAVPARAISLEWGETNRLKRLRIEGAAARIAHVQTWVQQA